MITLSSLNCMTLQERRERNWYKDSRRKRKSAETLTGYFLYEELQDHQIRDLGAYKSRSYNLEKQIVGLINHLFVRYPVPQFLYPVCLRSGGHSDWYGRSDPFDCMYDIYREWFLALAQGRSFPKVVKGVMTSKEAAAFLQGDPYRLVHENVWLAKMQVAGVPTPLRAPLLERVLTRHYFDDPGGRIADLIRFFARYHAEMDRDTLSEVIDFLSWKLDNDPSFSFKGRTAGSVIKLSNQWHHLIQRASLGKNVEWPGFRTPYWSLDEGKTLWEVVELRNNRELMNEGSKLRHCVYGYVQRCAEGRCSIFSLRRFTVVVDINHQEKPVKRKFVEMTRVTVEVAIDRSICQVRGMLNRYPTPEEWSVLNRWAGVNGFTRRANYW